MDQWLLAVTSDLAAKGSAKDLEVAGAGPVHRNFFFPPSFLTMCISKRCLSSLTLQNYKNICTVYGKCVCVWRERGRREVYRSGGE